MYQLKIIKKKLGTVGIPIDIGRLKTEAEDGVSEGEIIYEGPNVCLGYATTRKDLLLKDENKQILRTGDVGFIDKDGYTTITGRKKRFVKIFGMSVNLDSIESRVCSLVNNAVVLGEDDKVLVLVKDAEPEKLKLKILEYITFPRTALFVKKIPEIYLNSSGKPDYPRMKLNYMKI